MLYIEKDKQLENCTFIKCIMIICIVLYHSIRFSSGQGLLPEELVLSTVKFQYVLEWFSSFQNCVFVLVSGYIFSYIFHERGGYPTFTSFVSKKAKRLIVPYVFVSLVWAIPFRAYFYSFSAKEILRKFVLCVSPDQLWFLVMLFEVSLVFWLFVNQTKVCKDPKIGTVFFIVLFYSGLLFEQFIPNYLRVFSSMQMLLFYWIGYCMRRYGMKKIEQIPKTIYVILHLLFLTVYLYASKSNIDVLRHIRFVFKLPACVFGTFATFFILQRIAEKVKWKDSKLFSELSKNSMPIYLFHQQLIYVVIVVIYGRIDLYGTVLIAFLSSYIIALLLSKIMNSFKVTRFLIGN